MYAPSPFAANCFPATPKVSWGVTQSRPGQQARWFDLRMLQLLDSLVCRPSSPVAVHSLAAVIHRQHVLKRCGSILGWEHFKRQLSDVLMVSPSEHLP